MHFFFLPDVAVLRVWIKTQSDATALDVCVAIVTLDVLVAVVRVGPLVT